MFKFFKKRIVPKYFVSIGAGFNQLPLIQAAKKLGFHIIGVDQNTFAAGIIESDIKIQESIENYEDIYTKIRELLIDGEIKGILTRSYGNAVKTTSFLCEKFKIPYIPLASVEKFLTKKRMKNMLTKNKIKNPSYQLFSREKKIKIKYPFVIKPSEGHAKKGVKLISDKIDLDKYLKNYKNISEFLIEEYIEGKEIIALGIVNETKFHLVEITDKITTEPPYFVDIKHITPSEHLDKWTEINDIGQKISDAFEIINSPLLMELKITDNNEIFIIETAPEFGGEFLAEKLIPQRCSYDIIKESIKGMCNENFSAPSNKKNKPSVVVSYLKSNKKGIFKSFNPLQIEKKSGIVFFRILKDIGSAVTKPISNHDRIGVIVSSGKNIENALENAKIAEKKLKVKIK